MKVRTPGRRTQTKICLCYRKGVFNGRILQELCQRSDTIDIDAVLPNSLLGIFVLPDRPDPSLKLWMTGKEKRPTSFGYLQ